jgi:8-oxo-dGTP pyrophosphatase MutT (NUDIX family)
MFLLWSNKKFNHSQRKIGMRKLILLVLSLIPSLVQAYNAGILPYAKKNGQIFFLLGKEARGKYKNQWTDVGGKGESKKETGIREFTEETGGVFAKFIYKRVTKDVAEQFSNDYIDFRITGEVTNPGPKKFYTMFLAEVDYIDPSEILNDPYNLFDHEKSDFAWVNAQDFSSTLLRNNKYLKDYYKGDRAHYNPFFGDKQIRRAFATYFADPETNKQIKEIIDAALIINAEILPSHEIVEAANFLGVSQDATEKEIISRINKLRAQKVIRESGFWVNVAKAYETLTNKPFKLFEIQETGHVSLTYDFPEIRKSPYQKNLQALHDTLQKLRNLLGDLLAELS